MSPGTEGRRKSLLSSLCFFWGRQEQPLPVASPLPRKIALKHTGIHEIARAQKSKFMLSRNAGDLNVRDLRVLRDLHSIPKMSKTPTSHGRHPCANGSHICEGTKPHPQGLWNSAVCVFDAPCPLGYRGSTTHFSNGTFQTETQSVVISLARQFTMKLLVTRAISRCCVSDSPIESSAGLRWGHCHIQHQIRGAPILSTCCLRAQGPDEEERGPPLCMLPGCHFATCECPVVGDTETLRPSML